MKPTLEDFLDCDAKWRGSHDGITYELSWHGRSEYNPDGTWCYYLLLIQEQFYPDDWDRLRMKREDKQFGGVGNWYRHWDYYSFPDLDAHGGWTFAEMNVYLGKDGKEYEQIKVGCDYAHAFDRDNGYWEGRSDVERDAKRSINLLVQMLPRRRERCAYCGIFGDPEQFYTAINGARVHQSQKGKLTESGWEKWLPAESASLTQSQET